MTELLVGFFTGLLCIGLVIFAKNLYSRFKKDKEVKQDRRNRWLNYKIWNCVREVLYPTNRISIKYDDDNNPIVTSIIKNNTISVIHELRLNDYVLQIQDVNGKAFLAKISDDEVIDVSRFIVSEWIGNNVIKMQNVL